jgi:hypothetical protein
MSLTMGDKHPHLKLDPRFAELAARPYPWPPSPEPEAIQEPPGLLTQATNLTKAVVAHIVDGRRKASPEVQAERKRKCKACPYQENNAIGCRACGCGVIGAFSFIGLDMDKKRSMASVRCPLKDPEWVEV